MDVSKLKKRPPFPIEHIAVAVTFSGRMKAILAEAKCLADALNATLMIMHIGEVTTDKTNKLEEACRELGIDTKVHRIICMDGDPKETILKLCKLNMIDLLIMGALENENLIDYYLGSLARSISRKAKTSVLLLTKPRLHPTPYKHVLVGVPDHEKTPHTLNTAFYLCDHLTIQSLTLVNESDHPGLVMTMADGSSEPEADKIKKDLFEDESKRLQQLVRRSIPHKVQVNEKIISGKPGYAIRNMAVEQNAELLIINSPDKNLTIFDRIFTHDIEYILEDIPCNLLIVHSRL